MNGFRKFILRGNVVDLAVGVVIGAAFGAVVNNLVTGVINPIVGLLGNQNFDQYTWCLKGTCGTDAKGNPTGHVLLYGSVITALVTFLLTALAVYLLVVRPVTRLMDRYRTEPEPESPVKECPECLSKIPVAAVRCAFCTVEQVEA
ncbi:MAG TPA: large conductance mechanosensitive channel protein MscL [Mycobacteriales bacterium]|nr:large conductance mechanosensitive channel protein MscL [Mycobacteriales bacterium]